MIFIEMECVPGTQVLYTPQALYPRDGAWYNIREGERRGDGAVTELAIALGEIRRYRERMVECWGDPEFDRKVVPRQYRVLVSKIVTEAAVEIAVEEDEFS